ncbi:MAG: DUF1674 domain-containing protein [Rickettsiales bacterium]|jgi:hypothetical protein
MKNKKQSNIATPDAGFSSEHSEKLEKTSDVLSSKKENLDASLRWHDKEKEIGGRGGLDPVRFGDWEIAGKCVDF